MSQNTIETKVFIESDWEVYKRLRLASLQDSPDSFGSTFEREVALTEDEWRSRINSVSRAHHALPLVAEVDGVAAGLAWGSVHTPTSSTAHVYQMWVSPDFRGRGVGTALLKRIVDWAKEHKMADVSLHVTTTNVEAVALYTSFGFIAKGESEPLRAGSPLLIQRMDLRLGNG